MALTNTLKVQVDQPVWEWCSFAPTSTTAVSSLTTGNNLSNRYLYLQVSGSLYRYDTYTNCWNAPTNMTGFTTPTIMNNNVLSNYVGHYGRAISGGASTIQLAGLSGNTLVNQTIKIISGTGAGQSRTISAISAPIVADRGIVTTAGTQSIVDASTGIGLKQWKMSQWRDYQFRCDFGTGRTQVRPILYNTINSIVWSEANQMTVSAWAQPLSNISVAVNALYVIESHTATVSVAWTTVPDSTSNFVILGGGIWNVTQGTTTAPFFSMSYYDILADQWYGKTTNSSLKTVVFLAASDLSMERMTEAGGVIKTATATAGAARSLTDGIGAFTPMQYANFEIRITGGIGIGQTRTILSNTATVINVVRDWDTVPNATSVYQIWRDNGKVWLVGGGDAGILQYSQDADHWTTGKQLDYGQANIFAATQAGQSPRALTSITRVSNGISVLNGTPTAGGAGYNVGDILTITTGGTLGTARVLTVDSVGAVLTVALETCGLNYTIGAGKTTTVVPAGGTGCTLNITTVSEIANCVTPIAHSFKIGDVVTISGATLAAYNGSNTILGVSTTLAFDYALASAPVSPAVASVALSTTVLVDCTKNWTVNEHVGKLLSMTPNVLLATTSQVRRIISNTATSITWTLAGTAPVNGTWRYVIEDIKPFGTDRTPGGIAGLGTEGFATGGSATTLIDTTKAWTINYWARAVGRKVRIVEGTGVGNEVTIISNTATTLTYATQAFTPDTTSRYIIMDSFGTVSGAGGISTLSATPTVAGTGYAVGDTCAITGGTGVCQIMVAAGGIPSVIRLVDSGTSGYTAVTGVATTNIVGIGTGLTVNVTAITAVGSTTVMQDNTKNWETNIWAGKRLRFLSGTSQGNEYTIVSNTFNTITTAVGTAPDVSTAYAILESNVRSFGTHLDMIIGSTDTTLNSKYMYSFNGTGTVEMSRYNITNEHWDLMSYFPQFELPTTGTMYVYDGADRIYINLSPSLGMTGRIVYYDLVKNTIENASVVPYGHSTAVSGNRMEIVQTTDGLKYLYVMRHSGQEMWRTLLYF